MKRFAIFAAWLVALSFFCCVGDLYAHPAACRVRTTTGTFITPYGTAGTNFSCGTGVLVATDDDWGYVLTNQHVVQSAANRVEIAFPNGEKFDGRVKGLDSDYDLALVRILKPKQSTPVALGDEATRIGDQLIVGGYGGDNRWQSTSGAVVQYLAPSVHHKADFIEISTDARHGDSGGPIFDQNFRVAGIVWGRDGYGKSVGVQLGRVQLFLKAQFSRGCSGPVCYGPPPGYRQMPPGRQVVVPAQPQPTPVAPPVITVPGDTAPPFKPDNTINDRLKRIEERLDSIGAKPGPQGPQGPQGVAGPKGEKGDPGLVPIDQLATAVEDRLKAKPVRLVIIDENGKQTYSGEAFLGGEPFVIYMQPREKVVVK